jgi:hypothetical protein
MYCQKITNIKIRVFKGKKKNKQIKNEVIKLNLIWKRKIKD